MTESKQPTTHGNQTNSTSSHGSWSATWIQELFEDGCSILAFGRQFLPSFEAILGRFDPNGDVIHPPVALRLWFARYLLNREEALPDELARAYPELKMVAYHTEQLLHKHFQVQQNNPVKQTLLDDIAVHQKTPAHFLNVDIERWIKKQQAHIGEQCLTQIRALLCNAPAEKKLYQFLSSPECKLSETDHANDSRRVDYPGNTHIVTGWFVEINPVL